MQINGAAVRQIRYLSGLTVRALADKAGGIDPSHLSRIETGQRRGTPAQHKALAAALGVSPLAIATRTDEVA